MTTVKRDYNRQNIYTTPVGICNEQTSVDEEKRKKLLIDPDESISRKKNEQDIRKEDNFLIYCSWCTYLILSTRQSEFVYFIVLGIIIALYE